jgi:hypothetical protein
MVPVVPPSVLFHEKLTGLSPSEPDPEPIVVQAPSKMLAQTNPNKLFFILASSSAQLRHLQSAKLTARFKDRPAALRAKRKAGGFAR